MTSAFRYGEDAYGNHGDPTYDVTAGGDGMNPNASQSLYGEDPTYDTAGSQVGVGSE
jgi:hypothetical protein